MIRRYATNNIRMSPAEASKKAGELFLGFKRLCRDTAPPKIDEDLLTLCFAEQMQKIKLKNDMVQAEYYDLSKQETSSLIKGFLKQQTKKDLAPNSFLKQDKQDIKAGQGISQQPKIVNLLVGALVRAVEKLVKSYLKPQVLMGYGLDPVELSEHIKELRVPKNQKAVEVDVKEFDSQRGLWTDIFMDNVYEMFGVCRLRMAYMVEINRRWILSSRCMTVNVDQHFQSGRADTLLSNTLVSMAFFGTYFDWKQIHLGLFQGDDVAVVGKEVRQVVEMGFLKTEETFQPTFCGYFVTEKGLIIDPVAMAVKLSNRGFKDDSDLESYRLGVRDWLRTAKTGVERNRCKVIAANKYNLGSYDVGILYGFLESFARKKLFTSVRDTRLQQTNAFAVEIA